MIIFSSLCQLRTISSFPYILWSINESCTSFDFCQITKRLEKRYASSLQAQQNWLKIVPSCRDSEFSTDLTFELVVHKNLQKSKISFFICKKKFLTKGRKRCYRKWEKQLFVRSLDWWHFVPSFHLHIVQLLSLHLMAGLNILFSSTVWPWQVSLK